MRKSITRAMGASLLAGGVAMSLSAVAAEGLYTMDELKDADVFDSTGEEIGVEYEVHMEMTQDELKKLPEYDEDWWNQTSQSLQKAWENTKEVSESAWENTKQATSSAWYNVKQGVEEMGDEVEQATE